MNYKIGDVVEFSSYANPSWIGMQALIIGLKQYDAELAAITFPEYWKKGDWERGWMSFSYIKPRSTNRNGANK